MLVKRLMEGIGPSADRPSGAMGGLTMNATGCTSTLCAMVAIACTAMAQSPVGTAFTYQGRLKIDGVLQTSSVDLCFSLYDMQAVGTGNLVGGPLLKTGVTPSKGLFTAELDFGAGAFNGDARWLQIAVRSPGGGPPNCVTGFTVLQQRQPVTPAPYAAHALTPWESDAVTGDLSYLSGNVGIGTNSPANALEVHGDNMSITTFPSTATLKVVSGQTNYMLIDSNQIEVVGSNLAINTFSSENVALAGGGGDVLLASGGGNVGIGTANPVERLHVFGTGSVSARIEGGDQAFLDLDSPMQPEVRLFNNGNIRWRILSQTGTENLNIRDETETRFLIDNSGNVGIGNINPTQRLHVAGNICANGTIGACSDARFKTDITPVTGGLDLVEHIKPVRFTWRFTEFPDRQFDSARQIGFLAQQMRAIVPEVVAEGSDGSLSVDYGRLTPVLVEAVKELHSIVQDKDAQLATQREINQQQQSQIDDLTTRLAALEQMIQSPAPGDGDPAGN
jgi:hypothetical protein